MSVRAVEGKKPYTGGVAIEVTEDKVINLRLRDENNLIIWDEEDNEIYVDLQLGDEITPTDTFPVGITTGRAIVDNGWDATGTLVCFKTTSGDNIKLFYTDSGSVFVDNGTGTFKQIYLKSEVDALLATKQNLLTAGDNITIDSNNVISADKGIVVSNTQPSDATEGLLWYNTVTDQLKVYDGTNWNGIGGGGGGSTYTAGHGINIDVNDEISNTLPFEPTNTGTAGQVLKLDSNGDYGWDNESGGGSGDVVGPASSTDGHLAVFDGTTGKLLKDGGAVPTGTEIVYATQAEYTALLPGAESDGKHYFIYTESGGGGLLFPQMSSNSQDGYILTPSSTIDPYYAYNATDSDLSLIWTSNYNTGTYAHSLSMQMPTAQVATNIKLGARIDNTPAEVRFPSQIKLQGSNDGSLWTYLGEWTRSSMVASGEEFNYSFNNSTSYLYYRILLTASAWVSGYSGHAVLGYWNLS